MDWHLLLPFGPSLILSEAALCSLSGPSVVRQLMQVVIIVPGYYCAMGGKSRDSVNLPKVLEVAHSGAEFPTISWLYQLPW